MKSKWFKHILFCMVMISILLTYTKNLMAFSGKVHERINEEAILQNKESISNYIMGYTGLKGFKDKVRGKEILQLIKDSNNAEDWVPGDPIHSHFYNPLTNAAFTSGIGSWTPSAYARANDSSNQYSWSKARLYFYLGLTSSSDMDRMNYFYNAFEALGHVVHLLQDMAVPAHTRLDLHGPFEPFESYTSKQRNNLLYNQAPYEGSSLVSKISDAPLQLWDGGFYDETNLPVGSNTVGLAEYSAANFVSDGTIFKGQPHPMLVGITGLIGDTNCADILMGAAQPYVIMVPSGIGYDRRIYISKTSDDRVDMLAAFSFLKNATVIRGKSKGLSWNAICNRLVFLLDDAVHEDYAVTLVPHAVGYSAALMDHFFKSQIEISLPDSGVYASVPNNGNIYPYDNMNFTQITLKPKNILISGEDMSGGDVTLTVTYRLANTDPFVTGTVDVSNEVHHAIATKSGITIPKGTPVGLTFDLTNTPIPILATDVYLQIAYRGNIGTNSDEVAFGYKDISEPTPVDHFNNMDKTCLNSNWYDAGSAQAIAIVDKNGNHIADSPNEWDVYTHNVTDVYLRYSPINNPLPASSTENLSSIAWINAGGFNRALYILTDYEFNYSDLFSQLKTTTDDKFRHPSGPTIFTGTAIKRQTEFVSSNSCDKEINKCYLQRNPGFYEFRGSNMWWGAGTILINNGYPTNDCPFSQLNPIPNPSKPAMVQSQPQKGVVVSTPAYGEPRFVPLSR
ncbi:MAG: hypothetical protein HQL02_11065 [Nitrospirae bacterium]|nr:hypothetical protein [Nitrospirota bacterium]